MKWCRNEEAKTRSKAILIHRAQITLGDASSTSQAASTSESQSATQQGNEPPTKRKKKPSKLLSYLFSEASSVANETNPDSLQAEISSYLSKPCLKENDDP